MSYQVRLELKFEEYPTDEDVWNYLKAFAEDQRIDFEVIPPFEPPFDDPKARSPYGAPYRLRTGRYF